MFQTKVATSVVQRFSSRAGMLLSAMALAGAVHAAAPAERWKTLPPTPAPVHADHSGYAKVNGIRLYYAIVGKGAPVILLHGGLSNSDYWGKQIDALKKNRQVILVDSRGHGRSSRDAQPFGYDLMTDDVVALMDHLKIQKADIVGWSDGAIIGIDLALRHRERIGKVVAFAANTNVKGVNPEVEKNPTFGAFIERSGPEHIKLSGGTQKDHDSFVEQISKMWFSQPNWSDAQLKSISTPILVIDGDHDEAILRKHTDYIAATIPGASLKILPNASHFAFLQDPASFNQAIVTFLDAK
ncbi:alpha/beta fold hydrolase [Janthinobacterium agaricidamnosum]|uniref:alpha/beta fold hydrolase n=1 Tax=Janthinobacterium agaricidamnosum TaxID=55508 RepID=UPI000ADC69ED|nr:alpha/beta hydrolase [Janthinobacterium agaricidamnosum]